MGFLKALLGFGNRTAEPAPVRTAPGPFGLSLGRAVTFDVTPFRLVERDLPAGMPDDTLVISGHGVVDLGGGDVMHRFYDDASNMLQVVCSGGADGPVTEAMVVKPWYSVVPMSPAEWWTWERPGGGRLGLRTFEARGRTYRRVWGDEASEWIPPVRFHEDVTADVGRPKVVLQHTVSYARLIPPHDIQETLLVIVEQDVTDARQGGAASADRSLSVMLGYTVSPADVRPV